MSCTAQCSCAANHWTRPVLSYVAVKLLQISRFHLRQKERKLRNSKK
jgi:hypothetical protein